MLQNDLQDVEEDIWYKLIFSCWKCINLSYSMYMNHPKLAILCVWCLGNSCSQFEKSKIESTNFEIPFFFLHICRQAKKKRGEKKDFLSIFRVTEMIFPRKKWQFPRIWSPPHFSPSLLFICNDAFSAPPSLLLHDLELLGMGLCLNYEFKCI